MAVKLLLFLSKIIGFLVVRAVYSEQCYPSHLILHQMVSVFCFCLVCFLFFLTDAVILSTDNLFVLKAERGSGSSDGWSRQRN